MKQDAHLARLVAMTYGAGKGCDVFGDRGRVVFAFRGSYDWEEWFSNLAPVVAGHAEHHPVLGLVHAGFLATARRMVPACLDVASGRPIVLVGHSRGGAVALVLAALLTASGRPPVEVVTFGAPRAGGEQMKALLMGVEIRQYRRGADPVTEWPDAPFCHMRALLPIGEQLHLFGDHELSLYVEALDHGQESSAAESHAYAL